MVTDKQVRRLFAMKNKIKYLYQLADKAGMSTKTARKYLKSGVLPSQCQINHDWPTHPDAFAEDWSAEPGKDTAKRVTLKESAAKRTSVFSGCSPAVRESAQKLASHGSMYSRVTFAAVLLQS